MKRTVVIIFVFIAFPFFSFSQVTEAEIIKKVSEAGVLSKSKEDVKKPLDKIDNISIDKFDSVKNVVKNEIYGSEIYTNANLNYLPQRNIPNPENYILGVGDELTVNIFGVQEYFLKTVVDNYGKIDIAHHGPINVGGLSIEQAQKKVKNILANSIYPFLKWGGSNIVLSLDKAKTVNITLLGAKRSGNYNISSLSTLFHLLYLGGGPDEVGSFRIVKLYRSDKLFKEVDLYEFLKTGNKKDNVNLLNGDVVIIPPYFSRVKLSGEVKRKGIFELKSNDELLSDIVNYAGGYTSKVSQNNIQVLRIADEKKRILNINISDASKFTLKSGDEITFQEIGDYLVNKVTISGSIFNPGRYQLEKTKTIKSLIELSGGLLLGAYQLKGTLWRTDSNLTVSSLPIDFGKDDNVNMNFNLKNNDSLVVYAYSDLNDVANVYVNGEVRKPGKYEFHDGMKLSDLIFLSGGITEVGYKTEIEVVRKKKVINKFDKSQLFNDVFKIKVDTNFMISKINDFDLEKDDVIDVKRNPNLFTNKSVIINGEVLVPGYYTLLNSEERISALLKRSGNVTAFGNLQAARIFRKSELDLIQNSVSQQLKLFQQYYRVDTNQIDKNFIINEVSKVKRVVIDLTDALAQPGGINDLILQDGDSIFIPSSVKTVTIEGEVYNKGIFIYNPNKKFKYYLNLASGFTRNASRDRVFLIRANGEGARTKKSFFFFRRYPTISEGATIYIPNIFDDGGDGFLKSIYNKGIVNPVNRLTERLTNLTDTFLSFYLLRSL
jgi:protein involved in polysaccharide export with SLBB domain